MSSFNSLQSSFVSGAVSDKFNGRSSLQIYTEAVEELINLHPTAEGGVETREAFEAALSIFGGSEEVLKKRTLVPYIDARGNCYLFTFAYYGGIINQFYFGVKKWNGSSWVADILVGTVPLWDALVATQDIQWCYVGDVVVLTVGVAPPAIIYRPVGSFATFRLTYLSDFIVDRDTSATRTKLNDAMIAMHYPAGEENTNPNYLLNGTEKVAASGSAHAIWELTFKNAAGGALSACFSAGIYTYIKVTNSTFTAIFRTRGDDPNNVVNLANPTKLDAIRVDLIYLRGAIALTNIRSWYASPWDNINGYPKCVAYFGGRLFLGSTDKFPSTIWASRSDTIYRFHGLKFYEDSSSDSSGLGTNSDGDTSTSSFGLTQGTTGAFCKVVWMHTGVNGLYVGTTGGVELWNSGSNGVFKIGNTFNQQLTNEACHPVQPVGFAGAVIYVARDGQRIILLGSDGKTTDLTALSSDYIKRLQTYGEVVRRLVVNESQATISILTNKGKLFTLKLNTLEGKWGMAYDELVFHEPSVVKESVDIALVAEGTSLSLMMSTLFKDTDGTYYAYLLVSRPSYFSTIKEKTSGLFDVRFFDNGANSTAITVPSPLRKNKFPIGVWYQATDLSWNYQEFPVGQGSTVTLAKTCGDFAIGFVFRQRSKSLDLDLGGSSGNTGLSMIKRIHAIGFRVIRSVSLWVGSSSEKGEHIILSPPSSQNLVTQVIDKPLTQSPDRDCRVVIENRLPTKMYISAITYKGATSE